MIYETSIFISLFLYLRCKISVLYLVKPTIVKCDEWKAAKDDKNVSFGCRYEANPLPVDAVWTVLGGGNTEVLTDGRIVNGVFVAFSEVRPDKRNSK